MTPDQPSTGRPQERGASESTPSMVGAVGWVGVGVALLGLMAALFFSHPALALGIGALLALATNTELLPGSSSWGKRALQAAVVLLALRLDIGEVTSVSGQYLPLVAGYVVITLAGGLLLGRLIRTETRSSQMLSAGTAICGGTAVASLAPVLGASAVQIAPVMALVFLLNAVALLTLPLVGQALDMTQSAFGVWVALAVHDTSSVLGTAAAYGDEALELATMVKLGRTLWLIPLLVIWGLIASRTSDSGDDSGNEGKPSVPGFVLLFVLVATLNGFLDLPAEIPGYAKLLSGWLLIAALFCIGLDMRRSTLSSISPRLLVHALGLWFLVLPITWYFATIMTV